MISIIAYILAIILFVLAGCNQTLFGQPPADLDAFAGAFVALGLLFSVVPTGFVQRLRG